MPKMVVNLTEDLDAEIREYAHEEGKPVAWVVREIFAKFFAEQGKVVDAEVKWGGKREPSGDRQPA